MLEFLKTNLDVAIMGLLGTMSFLMLASVVERYLLFRTRGSAISVTWTRSTWFWHVT